MPVALVLGIAHLIVGLCIIVEPNALFVSEFAGLRWISTIFSFGDKLGALILILAGGLAVLGSGPFAFSTPTRLKMIGPQLVVLVFTLASLIETVIVGHYPDGYEPTGGWKFILADQMVAGSMSAFHICSVLTIPLRKINKPQFTVTSHG
jgi:hypothetical protein